MFIYVSKTYTATVTARVIRDVTCTKCGMVFHYELARFGTGYGTAPYMIGQDKAEKTSVEAATKEAERRLAQAAELVPCPKCHWVNDNAIGLFRREAYSGWTPWMVGFVVVGLTAAGCVYLASDPFKEDAAPVSPVVWIMLAATVLGTFALVIARMVLRSRINPNDTTDGIPRVPPGTPPALVVTPDPAGGPPRVKVVPCDFSNLQKDAKWAYLRLGSVDFGDRCCRCLGEATVPFSTPLTLSNEVEVPVCKSCLWKLRLRWFGLNALSVVLVWPLVWWVLWLMGMNSEKGAYLAIPIAFVLAIVNLVLIQLWVRPYRLRFVSRARGVRKIRFRNPAATALLIRSVGEADGLYADTVAPSTVAAAPAPSSGV